MDCTFFFILVANGQSNLQHLVLLRSRLSVLIMPLERLGTLMLGEKGNARHLEVQCNEAARGELMEYPWQVVGEICRREIHGGSIPWSSTGQKCSLGKSDFVRLRWDMGLMTSAESCRWESNLRFLDLLIGVKERRG